MYSYLVLINLIWIASAPEPNDENIKIRNNVAIIMSFDGTFYFFPNKASITKDQKQEFYYSKPKDVKYFCPIPNTKRKKDPTTDVKYQYCLIETEFKTEEDKRCKKEVRPLVVEQTTEENLPVYCGSDSRRMYKFAYEVCVKKSTLRRLFHFGKKPSVRDVFADVQYPRTYEICYDHSENRVIYTKHKMMSVYILRNLLLEEETALHDFSQKYSTDTFGIENLENLPKTLKAYELQASDNSETKEYELRMLVPTMDFALGHWIQTTHHLINYGLMHKSRLVLWDIIEKQINDKIVLNDSTLDLGIRIYTGTWGNRRDKQRQKIYLGNNKELGVTIPKIWWKVLYHLAHKRKATAIIMHNEEISEKICIPEEEACDVLKWGPDLGTLITENVYCCDLSSASETIKTINTLIFGPADDILELN